MTDDSDDGRSKLSRDERHALAQKRLVSVLGRIGVANARTLEQKISDAGPYGQRIDPHVLTPARQLLEDEGVIRSTRDKSSQWYQLASTDTRIAAQKLAQLREISEQNNKKDIRLRVGQALEIAVFRSLSQQTELQYFGHFDGIDESPDSNLYSKREPPNSISGRAISGKKNLDFIVMKNGIVGGIEVKNTRAWIYPHSDEVKDMLLKCGQLDAIPVLIGRRIPFVTFKLLNACGAIVHETYRQRYPAADTELVSSLKDKMIFGYHDIVQGNQSDARLDKFLHKNLPEQLIKMRPTYEEFHDLSFGYGSGDYTYKEFAARIRRRVNGTNEDHDR